ncbi:MULTISPECIES: metal ABC transporter solute-binding protein, Zn/Mn family [unclassified Coleofasciculus]|uniref:metal ABC transporter solute-binding protein, Zn/Mn family n=1 Tax=unclassified Coleofasciculus TaxID=2692782 RepID=UPI00187ED954|nr:MULTISPECIES: zinc ABC transporter substrate-binding protein [unclassified Coleofasciculus]MBE9126080.1 zinc ABC transporter substrate-binding protein [Coleofasciculus sp. LEGE 07081]MBE9149494.1 zinc ABC transporter substrate-binding protein [Coleofasciculus sp. LEGE 07092]
MLKRLPLKTRNLWSLAVLVLVAGLASCTQETTPSQTATDSAVSSEEKLTVVASNRVLCDLTEKIARDTVQLNCLLDPNQDPHTYRITPSDRKAVETAQLVLYGGYNLEPGVEGLVKATNAPSPKVAVFEEAVPNPLRGEAHTPDHEEEEHTEGKGDMAPDPHVWLDVQNGIAIVEVISNQLAEVNADNADFYARNTEQLKTELEQLDTWVKEQVATIPKAQRKLITTHDALGYYVQAYGFESAESLQGLSTEESPSAARVKELVEIIEQAKVPTIFAETTTNERAIDTVAREANVKVSDQKLIVGGLGEENSEAGAYISTIASNTCAIVNGLGGQCTPFTE